MKKILLIEDNLEMRENTAEILELANYEVITAENGKIGVEKAREQKPDVIICDIMMPELDGYGVLYALSKQNETASIPFIFLTAKADRVDFRKGMSMGADDYLTKPFTEMELLEAIESRLKKNDILRKEFEHSAEGFNAFVSEARAFTDLEQLAKDQNVRQYKKKQVIYEERTFPRYLFQVVKGLVKTSRGNEEGKEFITGLFREGDFFGYMALFEDKPFEDTAIALEDTEVSLITKEDFLKLIHVNRHVAVKFIKMLANDLASTEEQLVKLAYNSVRKRVADALVTLMETYKPDNDGRIHFSFSREDLANMAGTSTESGIRALTDFRDEGLVELKASTITIIRPDKLMYMRN